MESLTSLARTKSDQLVETVAAAFRSPPTPGESQHGTPDMLSRKSSRRLMTSPGRAGGIPRSSSNSSNNNNTHIRKSRSAQLKLELDELMNSSAALSRASSASLGLSFSFTGFTMPPEEIADSKPFSDDDIPEDIEAGTTRKPKFQAEPTIPIYLKAKRRRETHPL